jgi:hypothetical protein
MVNGVPKTTDCTDPEITIVSPRIYEDLSVFIVISGAVGADGAKVGDDCARIGTDNAELRKNNIVKIGR